MTATHSPAQSLLRAAAMLHRQNRAAEAMLAYQDVLRRWPDTADAWFNLAVLQRQARELDAALVSYQMALQSGVAQPEEAHLNRAVIYADFLRDPTAAQRELQLALACNPRFAPALLNLGNLHEDLGRREDAAAAYTRALDADPQCFEALARLANVQSTADQQLIDRLRRALAIVGVPPAARASLGFALGRLLDMARDFDAAFAAYYQANRDSRAAAAADFPPYDRLRQQQLVDGLIAAGTPVASAMPARVDGPRPIFVCGMFRSGSTLTEQLLASCAGVAAGGELDWLPRLIARELQPYPQSLAALTATQLADMAARYRSELARIAPQAAYVVDKRPDNFLHIGLIKRLFPDAKIVNTVREPLDNCLSIYFLHLDPQMSYALDLLDVGHYYREYRRLMQHWKQLFGADIIDFDYDALVAEPQPALQGLCASLGLQWTGNWPHNLPAAPIKTASVWQVREPLYRGSSGRSRHYHRHLQALRASLGEAPRP